MTSPNTSFIRAAQDAIPPWWTGLFLFFLAGFADGAMMPFFALWAKDEAGVPTQYIGLLLACYAGGELIATPFMGGLADRIGRRPVLIVAMGGVGVGFLLLYLARGAPSAAGALLFIGVFESALHATISATIADTVAPHRLRRSFAMARVSSNGGRVVGPAVGALLVVHSLGAAFLAAAAAALVGALAVVIFLPETRSVSGLEVDGDDEDGLSALLPAFHDRRLASLLIWFLVLEICGSWVQALLPLYAHSEGGLDAAGIGLLFSYAAALVMVFQIPVTHVFSRLSGARLVLLSGGTMVVAFGVLTLSSALPVLIAAITLFAFADMVSGPLTPALVDGLAPPGRRATYLATVSTANDLRDSIGPATGALLFTVWPLLPWLLGMPLAAFAAGALARTVHRQERERLGGPLRSSSPEVPPKPPERRYATYR